MATRVLLVDDLVILRSGLRALLEQRGLEVVDEASDGRTAVEMARTHRPDVVIMDLFMPTLNGIDATRQIAAINPHPKIVVLTAFLDHRTAHNAIAAGADALVPKTAAFEEVEVAIKAVMAGKIYFSPKLPSEIVSKLSSEGGAGAFRSLTAREREVLQLIAEGKSTKEIAYELDLSTKTIETHRRQVMEKLGIDNVAELTKYAVREGLTSLYLNPQPAEISAGAPRSPGQ